MTRSSPVSETVDDIRSAALWFEQQIENAKQDQITGFAVGPVVRGERAWARHCALYEAQQVFLKALGTSVLAQCSRCGELAEALRLTRRALKEEIEHITESLDTSDTSTDRPCDGCDGHECDDGCAYPGTAQSSPEGNKP